MPWEMQFDRTETLQRATRVLWKVGDSLGSIRRAATTQWTSRMVELVSSRSYWLLLAVTPPVVAALMSFGRAVTGLAVVSVAPANRM
jgi:hypothetical protein